MFNRKLSALGYPGVSLFNLNDEMSVRNVVVWLEDNVFYTELSSDILDPLHNLSHPEWNKVFSAYLSQCLCPFSLTERTSCVDWLLREAIRMVAEDSDFGNPVQNTPAVNESVPGLNESLSKKLTENASFGQGINKMAALLRIPNHPSPVTTFQAVATFVESCQRALQKENGIENSFQFGLEQVTLGIETGDKVLNAACKIARLLHVRELRRLQTEMDSAMVAAQSVTADPKTDEQLGRTGF